MPHNLLIVNYFLGHPGSVHDAYAFRSTHIYEEYDELLSAGHWVWADSAYPLNTWCIVPFKKPHNRWLTANQRTFNYHLSTVCPFIFPIFPDLQFIYLGPCTSQTCICCIERAVSISSRTLTEHQFSR